METEFSYLTATIIFFVYIVIDMLYTGYVLEVKDYRALSAATFSAMIYGLLAIGYTSYNKNIWYLVPLVIGAFCGTFLMVTFKKWRLKK